MEYFERSLVPVYDLVSVDMLHDGVRCVDLKVPQLVNVKIGQGGDLRERLCVPDDPDVATILGDGVWRKFDEAKVDFKVDLEPDRRYKIIGPGLGDESACKRIFDGSKATETMNQLREFERVPGPCGGGHPLLILVIRSERAVVR
jgi:hypothetical protein